MSENTKAGPPKVHWIRSNGFILGLILAVIVAFLLPGPGSKNGILHADVVNNFGIALILFLQGLSLALEKIKAGMGNWRLHLVIQSFTFLIFPLVGLLMNIVVPWFWPMEPKAIQDGFLYLCVLPSTVSTSVVLTSVAGGNTAGALFNAALSNIVGVLLTPVLVQFLMAATGQHASFGSLLIEIMLLTLLPFGAGMFLRNYTQHWVDAHKVWVARLSNAVILFIVYSAFCDSVEERVWQKYGLTLTWQVCLLVILLFTVISVLVFFTVRALRLGHADAVAAYFCSVKKTLAMGIPLAMLIFGDRKDISLVLLPVMLYHPLQLFVNGIMANQWARRSWW